MTTTTKSRRNLTLLSLLYDSGARVQEIYDLKFQDINLTSSSTVRLTGKGYKTRLVPILNNTKNLLLTYINENFSDHDKAMNNYFFRNYSNRKLTRKGISFILNNYYILLLPKYNYLPKNISSHVLRHSKAMYLY